MILAVSTSWIYRSILLNNTWRRDYCLQFMKAMKGLDLVENLNARHRSSHVDNIDLCQKQSWKGLGVNCGTWDVELLQVDILYSRTFAMWNASGSFWFCQYLYIFSCWTSCSPFLFLNFFYFIIFILEKLFIGLWDLQLYQTDLERVSKVS